MGTLKKKNKKEVNKKLKTDINLTLTTTMGRAANFNLGFTGYTDGDLNTKVNLIVSNMTGNVNYLTPGTKISDVTNAQIAYNKIIGKRGTILNYKLVKKAGKKVLTDALKALGVYARDAYPNNATIWKTTGYTIQEYDTAIEVPKVPANPKGKDAAAYGAVEIEYDAVEFVQMYQGRHWKKGTTPPDNITSSSRSLKMPFAGLLQGVAYCFQIRANGSLGNSVWGTTVNYTPRMRPDGSEGTTATTDAETKDEKEEEKPTE